MSGCLLVCLFVCLLLHHPLNVSLCWCCSSLPLACSLLVEQKMLEQLARVCRVVFFPEVLTSKRCVHCKPLGHDKRADYIKLDKQRVGVCPWCKYRTERDLGGAANTAEVVWERAF